MIPSCACNDALLHASFRSSLRKIVWPKQGPMNQGSHLLPVSEVAVTCTMGTAVSPPPLNLGR